MCHNYGGAFAEPPQHTPVCHPQMLSFGNDTSLVTTVTWPFEVFLSKPVFKKSLPSFKKIITSFGLWWKLGIYVHQSAQIHTCTDILHTMSGFIMGPKPDWEPRLRKSDLTLRSTDGSLHKLFKLVTPFVFFSTLFSVPDSTRTPSPSHRNSHSPRSCLTIRNVLSIFYTSPWEMGS